MDIIIWKMPNLFMRILNTSMLYRTKRIKDYNFLSCFIMKHFSMLKLMYICVILYTIKVRQKFDTLNKSPYSKDCKSGLTLKIGLVGMPL